jgi:hypothetical protein
MLAYEVPTKGKYQGRSDPRWEWWKRMEKLDPKFEWKMPIRFYGKVIDQNGQPVPEARIRYGWNGINGSNERVDQSDAQGMFSIEDIQGKLLSVRVQKEGYHARNSGFRAFEYAAFFEPYFHQPDPNEPVVFELFKKQESVPLVRTEQQITLQKGGPAVTVALADKTSIQLSLLANETQPDKPWSMRVKTNSGGLQTAAAEFPVEAPTDGYASSVLLDRTSPKPAGWSELYQGGVLYVKSDQGYGRVEIRMIAGDAQARITMYFNPSGSRSLEYEASEAEDDNL